MEEKEEEPVWLALAALNVLVGLWTVLFNLLVLQFYRPRPSQPTTHFLFFLLAGSDVMAGLSAVLHCGVLVIYYRDTSSDVQPTTFPLTSTTATRVTVLDRDSLFCLVTYFVTQFSKHISVFMNLVLSFIRTYHVMCPTRAVSRQVLSLTVGLFSLLTATVLSLVLFYFTRLLLDISYGDTVQLIFSMCYNKIFRAYVAVLVHLQAAGDDKLINTLFIIVPYVLPSVFCLVCCCVFVWSLYSKPTLSDRVTKRNRHIVTTVLILTVIFVVCCSTLIVVWIYYDKFEEGGPSSLRTAAYVQYTIYNLLPILNSALNPVVLIVRGRTLRNFVLSRWSHSLLSTTFRRARVDEEDHAVLKETAVERNNVINNRLVDSPV